MSWPACESRPVFFYATEVDMKKIYMDFVGSHSTGKTSVMEAVQETVIERYGVTAEIVPSASRDLFLAGKVKELHSKVTDLDQMMISGVNWARILACPADVVLCTDLFIRSASYAMKANTSRLIQDLHLEIISYIKRMLAEDHTRKFLFFYIPPEIPDIKDGVRPEDGEWRDVHDPIIRDLLQQHVQIYTTLSGTVEERKDLVLEEFDFAFHAV
jgi:hypothetical protein